MAEVFSWRKKIESDWLTQR